MFDVKASITMASSAGERAYPSKGCGSELRSMLRERTSDAQRASSTAAADHDRVRH